ncbi:TIGR04282 family arsenosugar biosynthesis glycosyltransferase [Flagellimonas sp. S174]|uniref:TIGR04282 family arsenosugar biosynthesis glycosyltransferase n=1 Tax=Flagellimonas sp. S174 TaxID=3410790 RepID=UPI003BF47DD2
MRNTFQNDTAILFFANSAEKDFSRKNFGIKGIAFFEDLTDHTLQTIERTGLPFFHFSEEEQQGDTFGERISHAFASIFTLGFTKVISVGNDSPNLTAQHILKAQKQVSKGNAVIGPSLDGGCYLMGLHRDNFHKESFKALPWQSTSLYQQLVLQLERQGVDLTSLDILNDIDSVADVKRLSNFIKHFSARWIALFNTIFNFGQPNTLVPIPIYKSGSTSTPFNKGSPFKG